MKTKELKNKTVFDFSDYPAIIEEITGISIKDSDRVEYYKKTRHPAACRKAEKKGINRNRFIN